MDNHKAQKFRVNLKVVNMLCHGSTLTDMTELD